MSTPSSQFFLFRKQENLFLCPRPPQELTDLEIFTPSDTRITFKLAKWDMSYHNQLYLCVIIPRYLYVINYPPCNSAYAAKRLNKDHYYYYYYGSLILDCTAPNLLLSKFWCKEVQTKVK